jgi:coenzyme F420-reducing hydrogenase gamma subunit
MKCAVEEGLKRHLSGEEQHEAAQEAFTEEIADMLNDIYTIAETIKAAANDYEFNGCVYDMKDIAIDSIKEMI